MSAIICLYSLFFIAISVQADWRFNPFTQKLDYYQQDTAGAGAFATSSSYGVNLVYPNGVADVLIIGGTATTSNDVIFDVTGDSEFDTANFSGAVTLGSTLNVTGKTTLSYGTSTAFTADNFYGTLTGTYASTTGITATNIWATTFTGDLVGDVTGNADTASALAANGANCNAGEYPLGVDDAGAVENCTDATTEINTEIGNVLDGTDAFTDFNGKVIDTDNLVADSADDTIVDFTSVTCVDIDTTDCGNVTTSGTFSDGTASLSGGALSGVTTGAITNASTTNTTASGYIFTDTVEDITGTTTIQQGVEFTDGTYGCYFVFGATTTLKCY